MTLKIKVGGNLTPILNELAKKYSPVRSPLRLYYKRYQACLRAISLSQQMVSDGAWRIKRPTETEIVELFVGKTILPSYLVMLQWMKEDEGALPDGDVWGEEKGSYCFLDLKNWMENKDKEVKAKGKGKKKQDEKGTKDTDRKRQEKEAASKKHQTRSKGKKTDLHGLWLILAMLLCLPMVSAATPGKERSFPDIQFKDFCAFIEQNFSSSISLTSVLVILFSITENVQLLSLHGRQQKKKFDGERSTTRLEKNDSHLLKIPATQNDQITADVAITLDKLVKLLRLYPYDKSGKFTGKMKPISHKDIQPVHVICPDSVVCETMTCKPHALIMSTKIRDIPLVTLIKCFTVYEDVQVLAGHCRGCKTTYYADHERTPNESGQYDKVYLNSAKYLKIGQSLWVDRQFSAAVLNGAYNFHASAAAYTAFCNNVLFGNEMSFSRKVSRRQIWHAFVQESIRFMGSMSDINLALKDNLSIDEVTKEAYHILGEGGVIRASNGHACKECTQKHMKNINAQINNNQSGVVGMDEVAAEVAQQQTIQQSEAWVKMVVLDGIVMGHTMCSYAGCTSELLNARGGVYCALHEDMYGALCHAANCSNIKVEGTLACQIHQAKWNRFLKNRKQRNLDGYKGALRRSDETWPWMESNEQEPQPHDEEAGRSTERDTFVPSKIYCVETICAPCGVVVAWAKFAKAESPTNILNFLEHVYPRNEIRPEYICIDKACLVLRSSIANGSWDTWETTSRFIVDSYHYTNHRATDELCRKFCNPAPLNGSAPNLVITDTSRDGNSYQKSAFNTQACEQLNAWLGGFDSILKRMTPANFDWLLHTMLSYHTVQVLQRQADLQDDDDNDSSESSNESDDDDT
ncbi:hypothetical protein F5887DRAFT_1062457 [Amanita rubescens]|nr:hypothetical protein F5887DRAFT_1062457 [Amanita rubescens]